MRTSVKKGGRSNWNKRRPDSQGFGEMRIDGIPSLARQACVLSLASTSIPHIFCSGIARLARYDRVAPTAAPALV
jgi:hypothetical protein